MAFCVLSNYLWIQKSDVPEIPERWRKKFEHRIKLLSTSQGKQRQQQIASLNEIAGEELVRSLNDNDELIVRNWSETEQYWKFCRGNLTKLNALAKALRLEIRDKRVEAPWPEPIASELVRLMEPRAYQPEPFRQWEDAGHGIFKADPGFGKTFIMCWSVLEARQYTLILAHTDPLVEQFITRFRYGSGDEETGYTPVTNCLELEEKYDIEIIGRYSGSKPDKIYPVTVATWQSFSSDGGRRSLKKLRKRFGKVLCDEGHVFAAPVPSSIVNEFHAKSRSAVTATPKRKDQLDKALEDVVGPITARGEMPQLPLTATLIATGCQYQGSNRKFARQSEWPRTLTWLAKQADRNDLILKWLEYDISQGRKVLMLSDRRQWVIDMADEANTMDIPTRAVLGGMGSKKGIKARNETITAMMTGEIDVITATQVFKLGIDIPVLDTVYVTSPMANESLLQQIAGRVRRLYDGKQTPVLRYFVDGGSGQLVGCAKATHKHLAAMNANIVLVPKGSKPENVIFGNGVETPEVKGLGARKGLATMAEKSPSGIDKLFKDLSEAHKDTWLYNKRLKG